LATAHLPAGCKGQTDEEKILEHKFGVPEEHGVVQAEVILANLRNLSLLGDPMPTG
jgi:hypothetical protein